MATYKIHALGDYADHITRFGPTDCFTTQHVRHFPLFANLNLTKLIPGRARTPQGQTVLQAHKQGCQFPAPDCEAGTIAAALQEVLGSIEE